MRPWHEREELWVRTAPFQFPKRRWEAAKDEVEAIVKLLGLEPRQRVLDMPCGPGRHALELARRGFSVTGVDRTFSFVEEAKRRAEAEKLSVEFVQADMRK